MAHLRPGLRDEADAIALRYFRRDLVVETKPDRSFVTEADQAIERPHPRADRRRRTRRTAWSARSSASSRAQETLRWYVDPIDGTHNFMRGVPLFGTLLAVEAGGELQVGVMSAPALGGRWYARRGGGAWAVGAIGPDAGQRRRIGVSRVASLADAHLLYGSAQEVDRERRGAGIPELIARSGAIAASATSGGTRWSPKAPRRRWSRSAQELGPGRSTGDRRGGRRPADGPGRRADDPRRDRAGLERPAPRRRAGAAPTGRLT